MWNYIFFAQMCIERNTPNMKSVGIVTIPIGIGPGEKYLDTPVLQYENEALRGSRMTRHGFQKDGEWQTPTS